MKNSKQEALSIKIQSVTAAGFPVFVFSSALFL